MQSTLDGRLLLHHLLHFVGHHHLMHLGHARANIGLIFHAIAENPRSLIHAAGS